MSRDKEERRSPRIVTENLAGSMTLALEADILNVSRGGLAIRTRHQLRIGKQYHIQIGRDEHTAEADGTVLRCRLKGTKKRAETGDVEPVYEAGIEFEPSLSVEPDELLPVMARTAFVQMAPRLFGRFSANPGSPAILESDLDFEVKKISMTGLLAETAGPPWPGGPVELEIRLGDDTFTANARIVNSEVIPGETGQEQRTQYGIEFIDPREQQLELLEGFVLGRLSEGF
jgi:hypothetical protein